jgi:hypothetical protein
MTACQSCGAPIAAKPTGRKRRYCSDRCRKLGSRETKPDPAVTKPDPEDETSDFAKVADAVMCDVSDAFGFRGELAVYANTNGEIVLRSYFSAFPRGRDELVCISAIDAPKVVAAIRDLAADILDAARHELAEAST